MVYSYTEKKRIRKDFGKRPQVLKGSMVWKLLSVPYSRFRATAVIPSCNTSATVWANRFLTLKNVRSVA